MAPWYFMVSKATGTAREEPHRIGMVPLPPSLPAPARHDRKGRCSGDRRREGPLESPPASWIFCRSPFLSCIVYSPEYSWILAKPAEAVMSILIS
jgi:hypothetical protein